MRRLVFLAFVLTGCGADHDLGEETQQTLDTTDSSDTTAATDGLDGSEVHDSESEEGLSGVGEVDETTSPGDDAEGGLDCPTPLTRPAEPVACEGPCF